AAQGNAYIRWGPPQATPDGASLAGYRVVRADAGAGRTLAFLDPRAPSRWVDAGAVASGPASYRVEALWRSDAGLLVEDNRTANATPSNAPAPATGLAAQGTEGGVFLVWRPAAGATLYDIIRTGPD